MKEKRDAPKTKEEKRLEQVRYIMEHWDELPERIQGRFEGTITTVQDFVNRKTG